jgi:hypothetical protein
MLVGYPSHCQNDLSNKVQTAGLSSYCWKLVECLFSVSENIVGASSGSTTYSKSMAFDRSEGRSSDVTG